MGLGNIYINYVWCLARCLKLRYHACLALCSPTRVWSPRCPVETPTQHLPPALAISCIALGIGGIGKVFALLLAMRKGLAVDITVVQDHYYCHWIFHCHCHCH